MKLSTHLFIELKVKSIIEDIFSVKMGLSPLCIGNVAADMSLLSVMHPHYQAKSMDFINKKIMELCQYIPGITDNFGFGYMLKLGMVTHYICDFFCKAHAADNVGSPKDHVKYEFELRDYIDENYEKISDMDFDFDIAKNYDEITDRLQGWLKEYHSTEHSCEKDIYMAIRASCFLTASVLEICYEKKQRIIEMFITAFSLPKANVARF